MKRNQALDSIMKAISEDDPVVSSTGLISRYLYEYYDSHRIFYMTGSMGLASSIALSVSINKPNKKVIVIDGDASLLMNLGSLGTIGYYSPKNLIHIVLDNNSYSSCSEEPSISNSVKFYEIAKTVGYSNIDRVFTKKKLEYAIKKDCSISGPSFILASIELGGRRDLSRPLNLELVKSRFMEFLDSR